MKHIVETQEMHPLANCTFPPATTLSATRQVENGTAYPRMLDNPNKKPIKATNIAMPYN